MVSISKVDPILISLYFIIVSSSFSLILSFLNPSLPKIWVQRYPISNISVDMNVIVTNPNNISRIYVGYDVWGRDFIKMFPSSSYSILSTRDMSEYSVCSRTFDSIPQLQAYQNYVFGFAESLLDFVENKKNRWYIRTTEDCFVNIKKLPHLIEELESMYDTDEDFVMIGQLCRNQHDYAFIHGGSGWIMSRKASILVNKIMDPLLTNFFKADAGDDTLTHNIREIFRLSDKEIHSTYFLGIRLDDIAVEAMINQNYSQISDCKMYSNDDGITKKPFQLNKVVFWHSGRKDNFPMKDAYNILERTPDYIHVVQIEHMSTICVLIPPNHPEL